MTEDYPQFADRDSFAETRAGAATKSKAGCASLSVEANGTWTFNHAITCDGERSAQAEIFGSKDLLKVPQANAHALLTRLRQIDRQE